MNTDTAIIDSETVQDLCDEHGLDIDAVAVYCDNLHISADDFPDHVDNFVDAYRGCYDTFLDFATELFNDTMEVPDHLAHYIDYDKWANDLLLGGDYWEHMGYVFANY